MRDIALQAQESSQFSQHISSASNQQLTQLSDLTARLGRLFDTMHSSESTLGVMHTISSSLHATVELLQKKIEFFTYIPQPVVDEHPSNQRRHPRARNTLYVSVGIGQTKVAAIARDFSLGGLRLVVPDDYGVKKGDIVDLAIKLPKAEIGEYLNENPMKLRGRVVRCDEAEGQYIFGVEFIELSATMSQCLKEALEYYRLEV